jgi:cell division protein FtsZ
VTVIAAGFDGGMPKRRDAGQPVLRREQAAPAASTSSSPEPAKEPASTNGERTEPKETTTPARPATPTPPLTVGAGATPQRKPRPVSVDDDLDVPEFLK